MELLESIDTTHGTAALLGSICVVLALHLILRVGVFVWEIIKKRSEVSEQTIEKLILSITVMTKTIEKLEGRLNQIERDLAELPKFKTDLRRLYAAMKFVVGEDKWPKVREFILEDPNS